MHGDMDGRINEELMEWTMADQLAHWCLDNISASWVHLEPS